MRKILATLALLTAAAPGLASDWSAHPIVRTLAVYTTPHARSHSTLGPLTEAGTPVALLVLARRTDAWGRTWLKVRLPRRPNAAAGWVRRRDVDLRRRDVRIRIDLSARTLTLLRSGRPVLRTRVIIGAPRTPTPVGTFAVWQTLPGKTHSTAPFELQLTGRSRAARGAARLAIHGMRGRLRAPLGSRVSLGCIRVPERPLRQLARQAPAGTRVTIVR